MTNEMKETKNNLTIYTTRKSNVKLVIQKQNTKDYKTHQEMRYPEVT